MRGLLLSAALFGIVALGFSSPGAAQNRGHGFGGSFSGPGTVLNPSGVTGGVRGTAVFPATGHPPGQVLFPQRLAGTISGAHVPHERCRRNCGGAIAYPVVVGGFGGYGYGYDPYYGSYYNQPPAPVEEAAPTQQPVIINQYFGSVGPDQAQQPEDSSSQMQSYSATPTAPPAAAPAPEDQTAPAAQPAANSDQPTLYLIAFKDHNIVPALAYWMEGSTLNYISVDHNRNQATIGLIDRDLSQRLNQERHVDFKLPN